MLQTNRLSKKKGVIYTCFTCGYDSLLQHTYADSDFDYICYTDDKKLITAGRDGIWQIRPLFFNRLDNPRNIRWHKVLPHRLFPEYKTSIWIDANIDVLTPRLFTYIDERPLRMPMHYTRTCVFEECLRVIETQKYDYKNVIKTAQLLIDKNMPKNYGMNEANIIIRKHHDKSVQKIMEDWWNMIKNYSRRDQLSWSYVLWKNNIKPSDIAFNNARNDTENFLFFQHNSETFRNDR